MENYKYLFINEEKYDNLHIKNFEIYNPLKDIKSDIQLENYFMNRIFVMDGIFAGCSSLQFLPNISEWNINEVRDISNLFHGCSSIISLPDISKWNINNVINISGLFSGCSSLKSLPDISKWNNNSNYIRIVFDGCLSLISYNIKNK